MPFSPIQIGLILICALFLIGIGFRIFSSTPATGLIGTTTSSNPAATSGGNVLPTGTPLPNSPVVAYEASSVKTPSVLVSKIVVGKDMSAEPIADMRTLQVAEIKAYDTAGNLLISSDFSSVEYGVGIVGTAPGQDIYPAKNIIDNNLNTFTISAGSEPIHTLVLVLKVPTRIASVEIYNRINSDFGGRIIGTYVSLLDVNDTLIWRSSKITEKTEKSVLNPKYSS